LHLAASVILTLVCTDLSTDGAHKSALAIQIYSCFQSCLFLVSAPNLYGSPSRKNPARNKKKHLLPQSASGYWNAFSASD
jgi:hypothetical protein